MPVPFGQYAVQRAVLRQVHGRHGTVAIAADQLLMIDTWQSGDALGHLPGHGRQHRQILRRLGQRPVQLMINHHLHAVGFGQSGFGLMEGLIGCAFPVAAALTLDDVPAARRKGPAQRQIVEGVAEQFALHAGYGNCAAAGEIEAPEGDRRKLRGRPLYRSIGAGLPSAEQSAHRLHDFAKTIGIAQR